MQFSWDETGARDDNGQCSRAYHSPLLPDRNGQLGIFTELLSVLRLQVVVVRDSHIDQSHFLPRLILQHDVGSVSIYSLICENRSIPQQEPVFAFQHI